MKSLRPARRGRALAGRAVGLALVLASGLPGAADAVTWYTVELVVFSLLSPDPGSESWPAQPGRPELERSVELGARLGLGDEGGSGNPHAFQRLGADQLTLQSEVSRLRRSSLYRPLLHVAWRQPGFAREEARAVHVRGEDESGGRAVDGTLRVWRERYLHVDADLLYGAPLDSAGSARYAYFRLQERRRMRSRELHFLDHPMFGVLVSITPYEVQAPPGPRGAGDGTGSSGAATAPGAASPVPGRRSP